MGVRRAERKAVWVDVPAFVQPFGQLIAQGGRDSRIVDSNQQRGSFFVVAESQRFCPQPLGHSLRFFFANGITAQANRVSRRNVDLRNADQELVLGACRHSQDRGENTSQQRQVFHSGDWVAGL